MKILLIVGFYGSEITSANTILINNIVKEWVLQGHEIICLAKTFDCFDKELIENNIKIYSIHADKWSSIQYEYENKKSISNTIKYYIYSYIRKFRQFFSFWLFPNVDPLESRRLSKKAKDLHEKYKFECVFGVFRPYSSIVAALSVKDQDPNIICCGYFMDLLCGQPKPKMIPKIAFDLIRKKGEIRDYKKLDKIFMPPAGINEYSKLCYKDLKDKIFYIEFPNYIVETEQPDNSNINENKQDSITILYAGTLDKMYRNPQKVLEIFEAISRTGQKITFFMYIRGDCKKIIKKFKEHATYTIIESPPIKQNELKKIMQSVDFQVNISNKLQNMVPSKIFELFATGKPIINFIQNDYDLTSKYFNKYPMAFNIQMECNDNEIINQLISFIEENKGKHIEHRELTKLFQKNSPSYVAKLIIDTIKPGF